MRLRLWLPLAGALVVGFGAMPVEGAPLGVVSDGPRTAANEEAGITLVHRRYHRHRGHRHARRHYRYYDEPYYSYYRAPRRHYYGGYGPGFYGGYGPGFGIYIGGGRGWGRHWW